MTQRMLAPAQAAGLNVTTPNGNSYTSDANGLINAALNDVNALEGAGFIPLPQNPVLTLALSTAAGVYVIQGAINLIPVSTIAAVATLAAPTVLGQVTRLVAASTGNFVITSSAVTILDNLAAAATVLTCGKGTVDLMAVGSTLYQLMNRSIASIALSTAATNSPTYGIASS